MRRRHGACGWRTFQRTLNVTWSSRIISASCLTLQDLMHLHVLGLLFVSKTTPQHCSSGSLVFSRALFKALCNSSRSESAFLHSMDFFTLSGLLTVSNGFWGPDPWLFVQGILGPMPWLFSFLFIFFQMITLNVYEISDTDFSVVAVLSSDTTVLTSVCTRELSTAPPWTRSPSSLVLT